MLTSSDLSVEMLHYKDQLKEAEKKLAQVEKKYAELEKHNTSIQQERITLFLENKNLRLQLKNISLHSKNILDSAVLITDHVTQVISTCTSNENIPIGVTPTQDENRRKAIRPMVGGHVIQTPVINLRRFNAQELQRMTGSYNTDENLLNQTGATNLVEIEAGTNEANASGDSENQTLEIQSHQSMPVFSGMFTDVKIYLTPLQNMPGLNTKIAQELQNLREQSNITMENTDEMPSSSEISNKSSFQKFSSVPSTSGMSKTRETLPLNTLVQSSKSEKFKRTRARLNVPSTLQLGTLHDNNTPKRTRSFVRDERNNSACSSETYVQNQISQNSGTLDDNLKEKYKAMKMLGLTPTLNLKNKKKLELMIQKKVVDSSSPKIVPKSLNNEINTATEKLQKRIEKKSKKKDAIKTKLKFGHFNVNGNKNSPKKRKNLSGDKTYSCGHCKRSCSIKLKSLRCICCGNYYHNICAKKRKMTIYKNRLTKCLSCVRKRGPYRKNKKEPKEKKIASKV